MNAAPRASSLWISTGQSTLRFGRLLRRCGRKEIHGVKGREGILQCGQTHPVQFRNWPRAERNGFDVGQVSRSSRRCR